MSYFPKDTTPINGSTNVIESNAVFDALTNRPPAVVYGTAMAWCLLGSVTCPPNATTSWELTWVGSYLTFTISGKFQTDATSIIYRESHITQMGGSTAYAGTLNPSGMVMEVWYNRSSGDGGYVLAGDCSTPFTFTPVITNPTGGVAQAFVTRNDGTSVTYIGVDTNDKLRIMDDRVNAVAPLLLSSSLNLSTSIFNSAGGTWNGTADDCNIINTGTLPSIYILPTSSGLGGRVLSVVNKASATLTVRRFGTDTINGSADDVVLAPLTSIDLTINALDWVTDNSSLQGEAIIPDILVKAASVGNLTLSGTQTVDAVPLVEGDLCLAKNQTTTSQNGPYVVHAGAWTRATGCDSDAEIRQRTVMVTADGTESKVGYEYVCTNTGAITIGSTAITYVQVPLGIGTGATNAAAGNHTHSTYALTAGQTFTGGVVARSLANVAQANTPAATTYAWVLSSGNDLTLTMTSSTGTVIVTTSAPTVGATSYLTIVGHATLNRAVQLTQAGVTWVFEGGSIATTSGFLNIYPAKKAVYSLYWSSATLCSIQLVADDNGVSKLNAPTSVALAAGGGSVLTATTGLATVATGSALDVGNIRLRAYTASTTDFAMYAGGVTPNNTNYTFYSNLGGTQASINASTNVLLAIGGTDRVELYATTFTINDGVTGSIQTAWTVRSDARHKLDIADSELGLDFIMGLRPTSYRMARGKVDYEVIGREEDVVELVENADGELAEQTTTGKDITKEVVTEGKRTHYGFIAQEVETLLDGRDFAGFIREQNDEKTLALRYEEFISPMVKAMQEQQAMILALTKRLEALENK
jgi:hypothetical protein